MSGGIPMISACRIHPDTTTVSKNLLTRESTITFGDPCSAGPRPVPEPGPTKPPEGAVVGVRIRNKQHNKKLKLEVGPTLADLTQLYEDRRVSKALTRTFGTFHRDEVWVGFVYKRIIVGPKPQMTSRLTITFRPPRKKQKRAFQLLPWVFAYTGDFEKHHLLGVSVLKLADEKADPDASVCIEPARSRA